MEGIVFTTVRLIRAGQRAYLRKWSFLGFTLLVFLISVYTLASFDLLPEAPKTTPVEAATTVTSPLVESVSVATSTIEHTSEMPVKIDIPSIHLSATIANPETTSIEALDALLLKGSVRYPTSARLGEEGNMVLFGHSSYLPIVNNQAYKTFNDIQKLKVGETITVYSSDVAYTYRVRSVQKEDAHTGAIPLSVSGKVLTLATCNSFATKSDRFVVTADFVESHVLSS